MIPTAFDYQRPDTVDGALALLAEHGDDAKLLAGGHSLLPLMKLRLAAPEVLIDVARLGELSYVRTENGHVAIGALTRHCDLVASPVLADEAPMLGYAASLVGDPQVRHRGTIGGSIAHGDPASDLPAAVLALDGVLVLRGPNGTREVPAAEFFRGFFETALEPDEMLVEVRVPRTPGPNWAFEKFVQRANDWAIVGVAVAGDRVALVNMGQTPLRAAATERRLAEGASIEDAAAVADEGSGPAEDIHATADFRRHLARVFTKRALAAARART